MSDSLISILNTSDAAFAQQLAVLRSVQSESASEVLPAVQGIIDAIRRDGDQQLVKYTQEFDRFPAESMAD
ncbi:MAG: histidinol dehydrogenase, partial [Gammaproteobacteria bacterium]|nr:histidinol dehydrogenase [Gammaproteobacteria bacterium]